MSEVQDFEHLRKRFDDLRHKQTQAQTLLDSAQQELARLKEEARQAYGTDDLEELKKKLAEMEAENLRKRREYQGLLDGIERDLKAVEERFRES